MPYNINIRSPVFIEYCGTIVCRGEVRQFDPEMCGLIDDWCAHHKIDDLKTLGELHYSDGAPHSNDVVELCNRLIARDPKSAITLVYVHRGHHRHCKTPLLQMLIATFAPRLCVHAIRVEQPHLPLDIVIFALAALGESGRCLIVRDNAIRLGTTEILSSSNIQFMALSRSTGQWLVDGISLYDDVCPSVPGFAPLNMELFSTEEPRGTTSLSLAIRSTNDRLGIINIVRV